MSEFIRGIQAMQKNVKTLLEIFQKLNKQLETFPHALEVIEKLQKTIEANEGNLTKLISEMQQSNENIKSVLDILKSVKE